MDTQSEKKLASHTTNIREDPDSKHHVHNLVSSTIISNSSTASNITSKVSTSRETTTISNKNNETINNVFTGTSEIPYMIYCEKLEGFLLPIIKHFKLVKLKNNNKNDVTTSLPPWNATVLLLMEDKNCRHHPYVQEAVRRRKESDIVDIQQQHQQRGKDSSMLLNGQWRNGVYWPLYDPHNKPFMRSIKDRPALMTYRSEVFWRANYDSGHEFDFVWDRHLENPSNDSFVVHYVQGAFAAHVRENNGESVISSSESSEQLDADTSNAIFEGRIEHPVRPRYDAADNIMQYKHFCSFLIRSNPESLVKMFQTKNYDIDAIVRHMFFKQLSEYKPCTRIKRCNGSPYESFKCFIGYKFHITMENSQLDGYVSEKVFNGALGSGIPIYFGAPDIGSYVNEKSILHCNINRTVIEEMRSFYPRFAKPRPFLFNRTSFAQSMFPTEEELLEWADGYLRPELEPCVQRVIELDTNDTGKQLVICCCSAFHLNYTY